MTQLRTIDTAALAQLSKACNAKTIINVEKEIIGIDSIENRILIFDTDISHKMISATDTKRRIIVNLNYFQIN